MKDLRHELTDARLAELLECDDDKFAPYAAAARDTLIAHVGDKCYLRALIEIGNVCAKDCLYCGIRRSNRHAVRYMLDDDAIVSAVRASLAAGYRSIVLQGGEQCSDSFTLRIERLLDKISRLTPDGGPAVTLSLGEQSLSTYMRWREAGARRYLLRIESSSRHLYSRIHPHDPLHSFDRRLEALMSLREADYQVGTGVMIGLPGQTAEHLAADIRFMQQMDIDMCGMGPYLEHRHTPLYGLRHTLVPPAERLRLSLRMVALLRLVMPDINIAATTALQAIDSHAREEALRMGANVIMPNMTPQQAKARYALYENKPLCETPAGTMPLCGRICDTGLVAAPEDDGTSRHYYERKSHEPTATR